MINFFKKFIIKIIKSFLFDYQNPKYNRFFYDISKEYVNFYENNENPNMQTNGEFLFLSSLIENNLIETVFDIGANVGEYSKFLLEKDNTLQVHCFEPDKNNVKKLQDNLFNYDSVHINNFGLANFSGEKDFYVDKNDRRLSSFHNFKKSAVSPIRMRVDTLDNYCARKHIKKIDLIKIDTEGLEMSVLTGGKTVIKNAVDMVQFEFGYASIFSRVFFKDFMDFFDKLSFDVYKIKATKIEKIHYNFEYEKFSYANYIAIKRGLRLKGINGYEKTNQ